MMSCSVVIPALGNTHVNLIVKSGLRKSLDIINLMRGKPNIVDKMSFKQTVLHCTPQKHRCSSIQPHSCCWWELPTQMQLLYLKMSPFGFIYNSKTRWHWEGMWLEASLHLMDGMKLKHISNLKTSDYWLLSHNKMMAVRHVKHGWLTENVQTVIFASSRSTGIQICHDAKDTF